MTGEEKLSKRHQSVFQLFFLHLCDGTKINIIEKGKLNYSSLPCLNNVLLVIGLIVNITSQLCDRELYIKLDNMECTDKKPTQIMKISKSLEN